MTTTLTPREKLVAYARECAAQTRGWEGDVISAAEVACRFGIADARLEAMRRAKQVIAFRCGVDGFNYPAQQFSDSGVVPALDQLLGIIGTAGECWHWLLEDCAELGEVPPLELLKQGRIDEVLAAAHLQYDI
jgi:hypothetical protein